MFPLQTTFKIIVQRLFVARLCDLQKNVWLPFGAHFCSLWEFTFFNPEVDKLGIGCCSIILELDSS